MSAGPETPPKFVPTLTEVIVPSSAAVADSVALDLDALAQQAVGPGNALGKADHDDAGALSDRGWLVRRAIQGIPANLPPLPDLLPQSVFVSEHASPEAGPSTVLRAGESFAVAPADDAEGTPGMAVLNTETGGGVVAKDGVLQEGSSFASALAVPKIAETTASSHETQEAIVQRSLYRVEQMVEVRLQETVAALVQEHAQALSLQLRQQVESIVRKSVQEVLKSTMAAASSKNENSA